MESGFVSSAHRILSSLDARLTEAVELTLYGRAALHLGFAEPPEEFARSHDVDVVLWLGQAEELLAAGNFWDALDAVNEELRDQDLYISHLFEETQVILTPEWKKNRRPIEGSWRHLRLYRLGDGDLLLSKLMRDDPTDLADARFIIGRSGFDAAVVKSLVQQARVPEVPEIREHFQRCVQAVLGSFVAPSSQPKGGG